MQNHRAKQSTPNVKATGAQRVLVATTAMLVFISFWRAAAVVLNDMGSSAFYAGAIAEHFVGKTSFWNTKEDAERPPAKRPEALTGCSQQAKGERT
jgi:hypothetical protein